MYKLLIIEDEKWEREGLVDFLDWSELKIKIIGTAANGVQGLKMAKEYLPEIIITEIKMPLMDGMEFARTIKRVIPCCKIIIITGYDDFGYAEEAIRLGVFDYLLKPIQKDQLLDVLKKILVNIKTEDDREKHVCMLKHELTESMYENRANFIRNIVEGALEAEDDSEPADHLIKSFRTHRIVAAVMRFDLSSYYKDKKEGERQLYRRELLRKIREAVSDEGIAVQSDAANNEIIICLLAKDDLKNQIYDLIVRVGQQYCEIKMPEFVIGIGSTANTLSKLSNSFQQAQIALHHLFYMKGVNILFYDDVVQDEGTQPEFYDFFTAAAGYSKRILSGLHSMNFQPNSAFLEDFFKFIHSSFHDKDLVCNYFAGLISELTELLLSDDEALDAESITGEDILVTLQEFIRLENIKVFFYKILLYTYDCISKRRNNKEEYIVGKVMDIISKEYEHSIGIEIIAYRLELSPNYLGSLFKQHMGKSFTEVLTSYRMKKAEELLISGTINVIDTAKSVGFVNTAHFCTVFKKIHGISPGDYQRKHLKKEGVF